MREEYQTTEKENIIADEKAIYESIKPIIMNCLEKINVYNEDLISFCQYMDTKGYGYSSVFIGPQLLMRIRFRGKSKFLGIQRRYFDMFKTALPEGYKTQGIPSDPKFERITLDSKEQILQYEDFLRKCIQQLLKELPTTFDCCSRYEECSNAGHCVNPYEDLILGCSYRRKVEEGIVFYETKGHCGTDGR